MANWSSLRQCSHEELLEWAEVQEWARRMAACPQDEQWHAEGDVWTHTKLVYHELLHLEGWSDLASNDQIVLKLAALLHDVGKPDTTVHDPIDDRIHAPKHAIKGERIARGMLRELGCSFQQRELVCELVRRHSLPANLFSRASPAIEVAKLSWCARNDLLFHLALADRRGRDSTNGTREESDLWLFAELAKELNCYSSPYRFTNSSAKLLAYRRELDDHLREPYEQFRSRVVVMSGLPGSGKDTWLRYHKPELPVVSLDVIRKQLKIKAEDNQGEVVQVAREECRKLLRMGKDFALNATNISRATRNRWVDLCFCYMAHTTIVYIEPPWQILLLQNKSRAEVVPEQVLEKLARGLQPPSSIEANEVIYVTGNDA